MQRVGKMKIYHYTKCNRLNSIFEDGFIATELKRTLSSGDNLTDYVWLTEKLSYPKTALPLISNHLETSLVVHLQHKGVYVDLDKLGAEFGRFYRFGFDSTDVRVKKWFYCDERKQLKNNAGWMRMESVANKVDDDVRSFWIATQDLALENFSLEVFDGGWKMLLDNTSLSNLNGESRKVIDELKEISIEKCEEFNIPASHNSNTSSIPSTAAIPAEMLVAKLAQLLCASYHR
jgi:hypothetical protein